ncbi:MAG: hypothetical protein GF308_21915 [Candidatus Heimdallarchaeota archaeon]|nr:hypothetical protein [Candidatus Heimdallarchaeota archaeon]
MTEKVLVFLFVILYTAVLLSYLYKRKKNESSPTKGKKGTKNGSKEKADQEPIIPHESSNNQLTLEGISSLLDTINPNDSFLLNIETLALILPRFQEFVKIRPINAEEANDLFVVWLKISYLCYNIIPIATDENVVTLYRKHSEKMQVISDSLQAMGSIQWLTAMMMCLIAIHFTLEKKDKKRDWSQASLDEIRDALPTTGEFIFERIDNKEFIHLPDEFYNEFGIALREEYLEFFGTFGK